MGTSLFQRAIPEICGYWESIPTVYHLNVLYRTSRGLNIQIVNNIPHRPMASTKTLTQKNLKIQPLHTHNSNPFCITKTSKLPVSLESFTSKLFAG